MPVIYGGTWPRHTPDGRHGYVVHFAATLDVLHRRAHYAGRKGNSARRRLHFHPTTDARAFRIFQLLQILGGGNPLGWLVHGYKRYKRPPRVLGGN